ncbi:tail fiber assembly protein, partial [Rhodospirillum sp. A1_3_36]|uniref:tail fiber assembly protein n=1 Tax=Rhodospirillum sp. A1_3_36 TaxID=3391666 RepID=UPI0039A5DCE9
GNQMPLDAVEISDNHYDELLAALASGLEIVAGEDGGPVAVDPPSLTLEQGWSCLRHRRDQLLAASDWRVASDSPLSDDAMAAWKNYRQALRDLPDVTPDPLAPIWPEPPR